MPNSSQPIADYFTRFARTAYLWACERLYHEAAWSYDMVSHAVSLGQWPAWRRLVLEEVRGETVLEIGFGTGELLAEMVDRPWRVHGLELSPAMQMLAARRLGDNRDAAPRVQATAFKVPFAACSFDTVISTFPAPYILAVATLAECVRVLRPGGRLAIGGLWVEPARGAWNWLPVFYGRPSAAQITAIETRLIEAGFSTQWRAHTLRGVSVPILVGEKVAHAA